MSDLPGKPREFWINEAVVNEGAFIYQRALPHVWPYCAQIHVIEYEAYADLVKMHDWYRNEMLRYKEAFENEKIFAEHSAKVYEKERARSLALRKALESIKNNIGFGGKENTIAAIRKINEALKAFDEGGEPKKEGE